MSDISRETPPAGGALCEVRGLLGAAPPSGPLFVAVEDPMTPNTVVLTGMGVALHLSASAAGAAETALREWREEQEIARGGSPIASARAGGAGVFSSPGQPASPDPYRHADGSREWRPVHDPVDQLRLALRAAIRVAEEARAEWDAAPPGMKAGKLLCALSGRLPGYRQDIDVIHLFARGGR